ncbi:LysR family transcriptional regulator [Bacillus sp. 7586-K]|uniref:DNA-binding transcriptional LysR family regulator n=1 Tax=Metabacillus niabensis TaxID=324854 RepID=A0ABT9Z6K0_9BACI|nr:LysR family transcriptional regulator [Metabacillus niabensis]MDQ0227879.1 DNA-binding transcriptional LysR family regulator [Metabacillus niabensis]PAD68194.1 LysR family transcriptional regulator [Bacillus sp. 7586-K]
MELLQLHYFLKVAKLEHMTKAAQELRIAQPALSKTIARLEEDLGVPLFERKGRNIRLSSFGKVYLKKVEMALMLLEEGRREVEDLAKIERGSVFLATTTHKCFSDVIGSFISSHPDVKLQITQASEREKVQQLRNGEIDFCITFPPIEQSGIEGLSFLTEEIFLAVPHTHRFANLRSIDLSELADDPFICIKKGNPFREMTDEFCQKAGFTPNIICEVDEHSAVGHFIRMEIGVAFIPGTLIEKIDNSFHLLHINNPTCERTYQIAWREGKYMSEAERKFREFFIQSFTDLPMQYP